MVYRRPILQVQRRQEFDDGSTWATCPLITVPWSRPRFRWVKASSRQPKRQIFKKTSAGKRCRLLGRGHFATNMALLYLFVHGTRCPFLPLLLPRSVLCSLQYVAEKKSSECCFLLCFVSLGRAHVLVVALPTSVSSQVQPVL